MSNAEIADRLASLAQLMAAGKENPFKVKAHRRAAAHLRTFSESLDELVHEEADLTVFPGVGNAIAACIREIVLTGTLTKLEKLRGDASAELASISQYPRLDPKRVLRVYKKLGIESIDALKERLASGEIQERFGPRTAQHIRQGLTETHVMLLYRADDLRTSLAKFLLNKCGVTRAQVTGDLRRRVEVIDEISFVVETDNFPSVISRLECFGGRTPIVGANRHDTVFALSAGILLRVRAASEHDWGLTLITCTGSKAHLKKLTAFTGPLRDLQVERQMAR